MKIWIDLESTTPVPFFRPIIREIEKRGNNVS
jgi:predicted glycosyltransferase